MGEQRRRVLRTSTGNLVTATPRPNVKGPLTQHVTSFRQPEANPTNSARILTDTPIRRSPDCMTIRRTPCFGQWRLFLRSNYPMKKNWPSCNDSINSGIGTRWMRNVIAWFAVKSSPAGKSESSWAHLKTGHRASFVRQNIVMRCRWNGCSQPTKS